MTLLFDRVWSVSVTDGSSTLTWERKTKEIGLDIAGSIEKNSDGTPNNLELQLFGLNNDSKKFLARQGLTITVSAGYDGGLSGTLFKGTMELPRNYRDGADRITEIKARDGAFLLRNIRLKKSFKEGTSKDKIAQELLDKLSGQVVNAASLTAVSGLQIGTSSGLTAISDKKTKKSKVVYGSVWKELEMIAKSYNLRLFVTDQTVFLISQTDSINPSPIDLNYNSGLVEVPEPLDDNRGYRIKSLLRHEFNPGVQIIVETPNIQRGRFNIDTVKHDFDSRGNNWYTEIEARPN